MGAVYAPPMPCPIWGHAGGRGDARNHAGNAAPRNMPIVQYPPKSGNYKLNVQYAPLNARKARRSNGFRRRPQFQAVGHEIILKVTPPKIGN